jgi:hypothetical protein
MKRGGMCWNCFDGHKNAFILYSSRRPTETDYDASTLQRDGAKDVYPNNYPLPMNFLRNGISRNGSGRCGIRS